MKQQALAMAAVQEAALANYWKATRRDEFFKSRELVVRRKEFFDVIEPFYLNAGKGRPTMGLERRLCIHFVSIGSIWLTRLARRRSTTA